MDNMQMLVGELTVEQYITLCGQLFFVFLIILLILFGMFVVINIILDFLFKLFLRILQRKNESEDIQ